MLIKGAWVVRSDKVFKGDIRITGEKISELGEDLPLLPGEELLEATGRYAVPGGVDAHTHFDMPAGEYHTADDFATGSRAALVGGTTTVIDFAECEGEAPLRTGLARWQEKAATRAYCDYGFHMTVSHWEKGMENQMAEMVRRGIPSFKVYTAYQSDIGVTDGELFSILRTAAKLDATVCVHCENGSVLEQLQAELSPGSIKNHARSRPELVEAEAVCRVLYLARMTGAKVYIVHLSTAEGLRAVQSARLEGVRVVAETCPQYLLLNKDLYGGEPEEAAKYVLSPPLRGLADNRALWHGLLEGGIQTVATDHCAFNLAQKWEHLEDYRRIPNGIPGVEQRLPLLYQYGLRKGLGVQQLAAITATNPARAFGLYPRKGVVAVGSDADIALLDLKKPYVITAAAQTQAVDYTPYEGMPCNVRVEEVFLRGRRMVRDGEFIEQQAAGQFVPGVCDKEEKGRGSL